MVFIRFLTLLLTGLTGILVLSGCAALERQQVDTQPVAAAFKRGDMLPVIHLKDFQENTHTLQDFKGHPFLLTFWAPWCAMCIGEMPSLIKLRDEFKDSPLEIVAVGVESEMKEVKRGVARYTIPFTILLDSDNEAREAFDIDALPLSFVVDGSGRVVEFPDPESGKPSTRIEGPKDWSGYQTVRAIETLKSE